MSAVVKKKGRAFGGRVDRIVVCKFKKVKVLLPIVFSAFDESTEPLNNSSICAFYLAVALRVVGCCGDQFSLECRKDVLLEAGCELRTLIGKKSMRKSVVAKDMLSEEVRDLFGGKLLGTCCKSKHFCKLVHED